MSNLNNFFMPADFTTDAKNAQSNDGYKPRLNPRGANFTLAELSDPKRPLAWLLGNSPAGTSDLSVRFTGRQQQSTETDEVYDTKLAKDSDPVKVSELGGGALLGRLHALHAGHARGWGGADQLVICSSTRLMWDLAPNVMTYANDARSQGQTPHDVVWEMVRKFFYPKGEPLRRYGGTMEGFRVGLFTSGNSYHLYTSSVMNTTTDAVALALMSDEAAGLFDLKWLSCFLTRGYGALRLSPKLLNGGWGSDDLHEVWPTLVREATIGEEGFLDAEGVAAAYAKKAEQNRQVGFGPPIWTGEASACPPGWVMSAEEARRARDDGSGRPFVAPTLDLDMLL